MNDDENDDEDDEDDCHEFDDMMRLAKNTGCRVMLCMPWEKMITITI
jgi:hypothetical protein